MSEIMKEFSVRYELGEEGEKELIDMFNKSLLEVSQRILEKYDGKSESSVPKIKSRVTGVNKKFASKKAEEYAHENNLSLDHFEISIDDMTSISNIAINEQKCLAWSGDFDPLDVD